MGNCKGGFVGLYFPPCFEKVGLFREPAPDTDLFAYFFRPRAVDYIDPEQEPDAITSSHKCKIIFPPNLISVNKQLSRLACHSEKALHCARQGRMCDF